MLHPDILPLSQGFREEGPGTRFTAAESLLVCVSVSVSLSFRVFSQIVPPTFG